MPHFESVEDLDISWNAGSFNADNKLYESSTNGASRSSLTTRGSTASINESTISLDASTTSLDASTTSLGGSRSSISREWRGGKAISARSVRLLAVLVRVHGTVLLGNSDAISHFPYPTPDPTLKKTIKSGYPTHIPG